MLQVFYMIRFLTSRWTCLSDQVIFGAIQFDYETHC